METKTQIRNRILSLRNMLTAPDREEKSRKIYEKVVSHPLFLLSDEIYCYVDFRSEVQTRLIFERAWALGKKTAAPRVLGTEMEFFYFNSFSELKKGNMGILEPSAAEHACGKNVLMVMPGAAFDPMKNRIGYGGGYYDKYISRHETYKKCAIAFSLQITEPIPNEEFDKKPEVIFTEQQIY